MNMEYKIKRIKITEQSFSFNFKPSETKEKINLQIKTDASINPPKEISDKTALLLFKLKIGCPDSEEIKINITAKVYFEFSEIPDDYNKVTTEICMPAAQTELFDKIDIILETMGYPKFDLNKKAHI